MKYDCMEKKFDDFLCGRFGYTYVLKKKMFLFMVDFGGNKKNNFIGNDKLRTKS